MNNKTWFITGASSGLGLKLTEKVLTRGDKVFATVRNTQPLAALQEAYPQALQLLHLDLTDTANIRRAVDSAFSAASIDIVVSNAGYGLFGVAEALTDAQISRQLATNLTGAIQLIRAVLPHLRAQGGGRIVQVSSEGGQVAYPNFSLYHASKWGIEGFVEAVAQEVAQWGIDFVIAEPGPTATQFAKGLDVAPSLPSYQGSSAETFRQALLAGNFALKGDTDNTIEAMLSVIDKPKAPLRVALGSIAYNNIRAALTQRLAELTPQKSLAYSADKT
ncbi:SDR family oxidoreductase [Gallaecimonas mangrovi]|uniref:SDR family oxidoreductase n=1 Tax=Gallaecimonas mangrovi TaxID=2291597 RepID=UPI000E201A08|nr:SDR family oxidoreductase [Gallaecimonas mangrovi]